MNETMLTLKPGVMLTEQDGHPGLSLNGYVRFAKDARQAEILRALVLQSQPLESLVTLLHTHDGPTEDDNDISLTVAEFILDFGEYLQS